MSLNKKLIELNNEQLDYLVRLVRRDKQDRKMGYEEMEMTKILYNRFLNLKNV
jgi:hypothetical protein